MSRLARIAYDRVATLTAIGGLLAGGTLVAARPAHSRGLASASPVMPDAGACAALAQAKFPHTTVDSAQPVPAGTYQPPGSSVAFDNLPAFCRVTATVRAAPGSSVGIELWLPASWNGRYQQVGNHGWAGSIYWSEMAPQLRRGFAIAATDDGHHAGASPFDVSWAYGHPEKIDDLAWRAVHELAATAKLAVASYYGRRPSKSYFNGCSNGGREGLREAQAFPTDFNGILIGGVGAYWTRGANAQLYATQNLSRAGIQGDAGAAILRLVQAKATEACASVPNAVVGGIIMDPRRCGFDPHSLVCKPGHDPAMCITGAQADVLLANSRPLPDPATGKPLYYGMAVGSEFDQIRWGYNRGPAPFGVTNYQVAYGNPRWNPATFDYRTDLPVLDRALGVMNAIDPDLSRFKAAGGKLIQYQGWGDAVAFPEWAIDYYGQVVARAGGGSLAATQSFYRLFMQPGVGHCGMGPGPVNFGQEGEIPVSPDPEHDAVTALMRWAEQGVAPARFVATSFMKGDDPRSGIRAQRPLCPHPQQAVWTSSADVDRSTSFRCERVQ